MPSHAPPPRQPSDSGETLSQEREEEAVADPQALTNSNDSDLEKTSATRAEAESDPGGDTFPEGGTRAVLTVVGGAIALFTTFGLSNSYGALQAEFQKNQLASYSPSTISWIGSLGLAINFAAGLPSGRAFDAGWFRWELGVGSLLYMAGVYSLAYSTQLYSIFLSYSVCLAIGSGLIFTPVVAVIGSYYLRRRSLMIGIATSSAALGAVVFPIALNNLFARLGFGPTIRIIAYFQTGCFALVNLLMRPRTNLPRKVQPAILPLLGAFSKQPTTLLVSFGGAFTIMGIWIPLFYIQVFMEANNPNPTLVTYCLAIINSTAFLSRVSSGALADRFGVLNTAIPFTACTGILCFAMLGATNTPGAVIWMLLYGFANGAFVTILSPILMSLAKDVSEIGTRVGYGFFFVAISTVLGAPIAGALLSASGTYVAPCCFAGGMVLCGTALLTIARYRMVKAKGTWKV